MSLECSFGPIVSLEAIRVIDFEKKKSSYKGHRVDALVLEGDEGRDKLR